MMGRTRRQFVIDICKVSAATTFCWTSRGFASPSGLPLGLQLFSVREMLSKDFEGTLKQVASLGYREVEAAGFYSRSPAQVKAAMQAAGLSCVSAHYSFDDLSNSLEEIIAYGRALGLQYIICGFPGFKDSSRVKGKSYNAQIQSFTLDDLRWSAERFNDFGRKIKVAGMKFGYHNHTMEFPPRDGVIPFDEMIRLTDPELVCFELDCGWVIVGGGDPVAYLQRYPRRIAMLHIKDFKPTGRPFSITDSPPAAELGRGTIDNRRILAAGQAAGIRHRFVEQEDYDMSPLDALKKDAEYMRDIHL